MTVTMNRSPESKPSVDLAEEQDRFSSQLSSSTRTVLLSVLGLSWGILVGVTQATLPLLDATVRRQLLITGAVAVIALSLDMVQYLLGYLEVTRLLQAIDAGKRKSSEYSPGSFLYRLARAAFWGKVGLAMFATLLLSRALLPFLLSK